MNGSSFPAFQGEAAQTLEIPGSELVRYVPWIALAGYIASVLAIRAMTKTAPRLAGFIVATLIAHTMIGYPLFLLDHGSTRIPVKDLVSNESRLQFEAKYPVKWVSHSTHEGSCFRVRKDQYSEEIATYITKLINRQAESGRDGRIAPVPPPSTRCPPSP